MRKLVSIITTHEQGQTTVEWSVLSAIAFAALLPALIAVGIAAEQIYGSLGQDTDVTAGGKLPISQTA